MNRIAQEYLDLLDECQRDFGVKYDAAVALVSKFLGEQDRLGQIEAIMNAADERYALTHEIVGGPCFRELTHTDMLAIYRIANGED